MFLHCAEGAAQPQRFWFIGGWGHLTPSIGGTQTQLGLSDPLLPSGGHCAPDILYKEGSQPQDLSHCGGWRLPPSDNATYVAQSRGSGGLHGVKIPKNV